MRQIRVRSTFPIFSTIFSPYFTVLQLNAGLRKSPKNLNIHSEFGNKELKRTVSRLVSRNSTYYQHYVKRVYIWIYSGLYFPAFELSIERYSVCLRIQLECGKIQTRISPNMNTCHALTYTNYYHKTAAVIKQVSLLIYQSSVLKVISVKKFF